MGSQTWTSGLSWLKKNVPLKTAETSWSRSADLIFSFPLVVSENDGVVSAESMKTDIVSSEGKGYLKQCSLRLNILLAWDAMTQILICI